MIRGPQGARMLRSSQPNGEFARVPTRIFIWRQSFRVSVRADGIDSYGKSESLRGARGGPDRRRVPAAQRNRRREALPRRGRSRHARRGRNGLSDGPECPGCGARVAWRDGSIALGVPRWRCRCCGRRFTSLTGTVLEHCRKPLATLVPFIRSMRHDVPVECATELCGVTHKTVFEWRRRVLATVSGYQDRIVLRDTVWVDETYVNDTDLSRGYGQARKRGLSRQKLCTCVAIDIHKNPVTAHPRPGENPRRAGQGRRTRERGALVRRERPGLPGADGDGERPVLLAQALPLALHGDVAAEPSGLSRLAHLPLSGQPGARQAEPDHKGGAPYSDCGRDLPQLGIGVASPVI